MKYIPYCSVCCYKNMKNEKMDEITILHNFFNLKTPSINSRMIRKFSTVIDVI